MRVPVKGFYVPIFLLLGASIAFAQTFGVKKRSLKPYEFGNVVMNSFSEENNVAPVVFKHWVHRAKYTCRLCHVDLGFAMEAGATGVRDYDNTSGLYCGACHNGKEAFGPKTKTRAGQGGKNCDRCHSYGKHKDTGKAFYDFAKGFPRARFGNKVDWLKAEEKGLLKLKDHLEGITIKRRALKIPVDTEIKSDVAGMPDIIFSHKKHAVWNGCELCHPEIFGVKKGATVYEMQDIFEGKYCGACHGKVAFTNMDCQLCHTKEVY
jgi:c(7)-type cytochrome triheme protein